MDFEALMRKIKASRLCRDERGIKETLNMPHLLRDLWRHDQGQDIAEYAVILAVILVLVVGTIRLVGSNANNAFSSVASSIQ
jgi:Flp pilus assembly pilin Flp